MNIGIDIDGVLTDEDTYRLDTMTKYSYENNLSDLEYPYEYESSKYNWTKEFKEGYLKEYFFTYIKNANVRKYASEVIQKLHNDGNRIIIITGRSKALENSKLGQQVRDDTINWLNKNKIVYDEICFAPCPKVNEVKEKKIDIMIEDYPETILEITKYTKVLCFDNRYNINLNCDNKIRVFSWYDIYRKIKDTVICNDT